MYENKENKEIVPRRKHYFPQDECWEKDETVSYLGKLYLGDYGAWKLFASGHFFDRVEERVERQEGGSKKNYALERVSVWSEDVLADYPEAMSTLLNRWDTGCFDPEWGNSLQRFQAIDRLGRLSWVFNARPDFKEIYLVTVLNTVTEYGRPICRKDRCLALDYFQGKDGQVHFEGSYRYAPGCAREDIFRIKCGS